MSASNATALAPTVTSRATSEDVVPLAKMLAQVFHDDPVVTWMFPDPVRRRLLLPGCFALDVGFGMADHLVDSTSLLASAAVWFHPDAQDREAQVTAYVEGYLEAAEESGERVGQLLAFLDGYEPAKPNYTLELIGTLWPGHGFGSRILAPGLARCDDEGVPAHLWSSNPRNLSFYRRHGFELIREARLPDGPPAWQMWRPATT